MKLIDKYFDGKKISLPYQFWYPELDIRKDRLTKEKYFEFENNLKQECKYLSKEAIVYIHIPFCNSRCMFCDFEKDYNFCNISQYLQKIIYEIEAYGKLKCVKDMFITSIYIGGGTPTLLSEDALKNIFDCVRKNFYCSEDTTIIVEGSPNTLINREKVAFLKSQNVSRISVGVQTFDLKWRKIMNIASSINDIYKTIENANKCKLPISMDLIFGYDDYNKEIERLKNDISIITDFNVASIEMNLLYSSPLLSNSIITKRYTTKEITSLILFIKKYMKTKGFDKYSDVSFKNKPDTKLVLDDSYFGQSDYIPNCIGIGAGAFGFLNGYRYRNKLHNTYINDKKVFSYLMLRKLSYDEIESLRLVGFPKRLKLKKAYANDNYLFNKFHNKIDILINENILIDNNAYWNLSEEAEGYIDNIFFYLLDDKNKEYLRKNNLITWFN